MELITEEMNENISLVSELMAKKAYENITGKDAHLSQFEEKMVAREFEQMMAKLQGGNKHNLIPSLYYFCIS